MKKCLLILFLFLNFYASGQVVWTGANNTMWNNGGNWNTGNAPTATDSVIIPVVTNYPNLTGATVTIGSLLIRGDWQWAAGNKTLIINRYLRITGSLTLRTNNTITCNSAGFGIVTITNNGTLTMNGNSITANFGSLTNNGALNVAATFTNNNQSNDINLTGNFHNGNSGIFAFRNFMTLSNGVSNNLTIGGNFRNDNIFGDTSSTVISVAGNWINNGTFSTVAGPLFPTPRIPKVVFNSSLAGANQKIRLGTGLNNFPILEINQAGAGSVVEMYTDISIAYDLILTAGTLKSGITGVPFNIFITRNWYSNGGLFDHNSGKVTFAGTGNSLISTTVPAAIKAAATTFYNLDINKNPGFTVSNAATDSVLVQVVNNMTVIKGAYKMVNRSTPGTPQIQDMVIGKDLTIINGGCFDMTNGAVTRNVNSANTYLYLGGNLTDLSLTVPTGPITSGLWIGPLGSTHTNFNITPGIGNSIANKPTILFNGAGIQNVSGIATNNVSRGQSFTGLSLPNVRTAGTNNEVVTASNVRVRGTLIINANTKFTVGSYLFFVNDLGTGATNPTPYIASILVNTGGTFTVNPGASVYLYPQNKILSQVGSTVSFVGTGGSAITFDRDGGVVAATSLMRYSLDLQGNVAARYINFLRLDPGGNASYTTNNCAGTQDNTTGANFPTIVVASTASLASSPNNFSNCNFNDGVLGSIILQLECPLTVGVNDTISNVFFIAITANSKNCYRPASATNAVIFKNSSGNVGGTAGPTNECDDAAASTGKVRWSSSTTISWIGTVSTDWFNPSNWSPATVPTATVIARIPLGCPNYPILTGNAVCGQLDIGYTGAGASPFVDLGSFTLDVQGDGSSVLGDVNIANNSGYQIRFSSGTLKLRGSFTFTDVGSIVPGSGTIEFYNAGSAFISSSGTQNLIYNFYNMIVNKGIGGSLNLTPWMTLNVINNFTILTGSCINGTGTAPINIGGNLNIQPGAILNSRYQLVTFNSNAASTFTILSSGNIIPNVRFSAGTIPANYNLLDNLNVNTSLGIDNGYTLQPNGNTLFVDSASVNTGGTLTIGPGSTLAVDSSGTVLVNSAATINLVGSAGLYASVDCQKPSGTYAFTVNGTLAARYYLIQRTDANGLNLSSGGTLSNTANNLSDGIFDYGTARDVASIPGPGVYIMFNANATTGITYIINNILFNNSSGNAVYASSVTGPALANAGIPAGSGSHAPGKNIYIISNSSGVLGGISAYKSEYENPAFSRVLGYIRWQNIGKRWDGGAGTSNWNDALNWTDDIVPGITDNVVLTHSNFSGPYTVIVSGTAGICNSIEIKDDDEGFGLALGSISLIVDENLTTLDNITSGVNSYLTVMNGRTLTIGGTISNQGTIDAQTGSTFFYNGLGTNNLGHNNFYNLIIGGAGSRVYSLWNNTTINGKLTIQANSTLDVSVSNFPITLYGDYQADGSLNPRTGNFNFMGGNLQIVSTPSNFYRVTVDKTANYVNLTGGDMYIEEGLLLENFNIKTNSYMVQMGINGSVLTYGSQSFIDGILSLYFSSVAPVTKTYPVGKGTEFMPIDLTLGLASATPTRVSSEFFTRYVTPVPTIPVYGGPYESPIDHISGIHYWQVNQLDPTPIVSGKIKLPWNIYDLVYNNASLLIARGAGPNATPNWYHQGAANIAGNPSAGTIESSINFTALGPFTLSTYESFEVNPLPVLIDNFKATASKQFAMLSWDMYQVKNNEIVAVERRIGNKKFETVGKVTLSGNGTYQYLDPASHADKVYYRLKIESGSETEYSDIRSVNYNNDEQGISIYPNPSSGNEIHLEIAGVNSGEITLTIFDQVGKIAYTNKYLINNSGKFALLNITSHLTPGMYTVSVNGENNSYQSNLIVK